VGTLSRVEENLFFLLVGVFFLLFITFLLVVRFPFFPRSTDTIPRQFCIVFFEEKNAKSSPKSSRHTEKIGRFCRANRSTGLIDFLVNSFHCHGFFFFFCF